MPGSLKTSEYLLLAGPLGKYLLEGCMHAEVSAHKVTQQWSSAESVRQHGPCWAWSMFGFERLWCRLKNWMTQTSHPEATMINSWKAFTTCCIADPARAEALHQVSDSRSHAAAAAAGALPSHYLPHMFNRQTYKLQLPQLVQNSASTLITLSDSHGEKQFGSKRTQTTMAEGQSCTCCIVRSLNTVNR